jgi:SH3-like domain-containing protein
MVKRFLPLLALAGIAASAFAADKPRTPYFASITASEARMRTGPGRQYPASWLYRRAGLPVRVVAIYQDWRKVEDPGGTQGWMLANLLSSTRTAMVLSDNVELRDAPTFGARVLWRAAPNVIGRISKCSRGWCYFDVKGRSGYVEATRLWGVDPGEVIG